MTSQPCLCCAYRASGTTNEAVARAMSAHEQFVHGLGMSSETHALMREAYADR